MIDLQRLAQRLTDKGLINKSFMDCSQSEIESVCEAVLASIGKEVPPGGWVIPRLVDGLLITPFDSHPQYHWWTSRGQPLRKTLLELDAPFEVAAKYIERLTAEEWANELIPF